MPPIPQHTPEDVNESQYITPPTQEEIDRKLAMELDKRARESADYVEREQEKQYMAASRQTISKKMQRGDIDGMKSDAALLSQMKATDLMLTAESESDQLKAAMFILSQNGHGEIKQVQHSIEYTSMPVDQLAAMVRSRVSKLTQINPEFSKLLPANSLPVDTIEVESTEEESPVE